MEALANALTTPFVFRHFKTNSRADKRHKLACYRKNENGKSLISEASQELEGHNINMLQDASVPTTASGERTSESDIWKLFSDAQKNILYLNKQRLIAMEELRKNQRENQLLLARIEQLESEKQTFKMGGNLLSNFTCNFDSLSFFCELVLRIDSMVISGLIETQEATDLRKMVIGDKVSVADSFSEIESKTDAELLKQLRHFSDERKRNGLHIVHICTEMTPLVSVSSLASYVTGLSRAMQRKGNFVEVILPRYSSLDLAEVTAFREIKACFHSYFGNHWHENRIWTGIIHGIGVTFIEPVQHSSFFNRDRIYGYPDDFERFLYFSRASLDYIVKSGKKPDILHTHNWQTSFIGPLFWDVFVNQGLGGTRILLTCHDFNSQCLEHPEKLALCGLNPTRLHRSDRLQDNLKTHLVNILKGGVVYSNKVMLVSFIHSKDVIIQSFSHGLESTLAIHKEKLLVTPYGFDGSVWDPSKDKFLPAKYSVDDMSGKAICKAALRKQLGFSGNDSAIVVGCIYSKALNADDLENLKSAVWLALRKGAQFVFLGFSKEDSALESFQKEVQDENVRFVNKNEALLHVVLAGLDIILCRYHDTSLEMSLKTIKYGAAPVAITLKDEGFRQSAQSDFGSTNLSQYITSFANLSLGQALDQIRNDPSQWLQKIRDGMSKDFSWNGECCDIHSAAYVSIKNL